MTYEEKKMVANKYLMDIVGFEWDDLADTNSLYDAETLDEIHEACEERIENDIY
jgi:hypothetical protein